MNEVVGGARGCTGLTERGFAQVRALRDRLVAEQRAIDVVVSSTLPRAMQTADVVAEALGLEVERIEDLCERIPGEADGCTWADWRERYWSEDHDDQDALSPGGESAEVFLERVGRVLDDLRTCYEGRTVLACVHGGIIFGSVRVLLRATTSRRDPKAAWLQADFTSINEWSYARDRWRLVRLNDVAHLEGTGLLEPDVDG